MARASTHRFDDVPWLPAPSTIEARVGAPHSDRSLVTCAIALVVAREPRARPADPPRAMPEGSRRVLLTHVIGRGWGVPCGHLEPGERPVDGAVRELTEETGVTLAAEALSPLGVLHMTLHGPALDGYPYPYPVSQMWVWEATLDTAPDPHPLLADECDVAAWCTPAEARERVGHDVAWPFVEYLLARE